MASADNGDGWLCQGQAGVGEGGEERWISNTNSNTDTNTNTSNISNTNSDTNTNTSTTSNIGINIINFSNIDIGAKVSQE